MAVIAYVYSLDAGDNVSETIGLRETPFPGDTIKLADGRTLRVSRRQFNQLTGDDNIDVELGVRLE